MAFVSDCVESAEAHKPLIRSVILKGGKRRVPGSFTMHAFLIVGLGCFCTAAAPAAMEPPQSGVTSQEAQPQAAPTYVAFPCPPTPSLPIQYMPNPCVVVPYPPAPCVLYPYPVIPYFATPNTGAPSTDQSTQPQNANNHNPTITTPKCAEPKPPAPCSPDSKLTDMQTPYKVISLVGCIGVQMNAPKPSKDFTCDLMAVSPGEKDDVFGKKDWYPTGHAAVKTNWPQVSTAILAAVNGKPLQGPSPGSQTVGLRATIPAGNASCPEGQYVIVMDFKTSHLELYFEQCLIGQCPINDNENWTNILTATGVAPAPKSASP
jgi:hypothetical protein